MKLQLTSHGVVKAQKEENKFERLLSHHGADVVWLNSTQVHRSWWLTGQVLTPRESAIACEHASQPERVYPPPFSEIAYSAMSAPVVYKDVVEGAKLEFSGTLFSGKKFWVALRVPARNQLLNDIKVNGGEVVQLEKKADYLIADHVRQNGPPGSTSYKFIEESIKQGELCDPKDYPAGPPLGAAREPGSIHQPAKSVRAAYTAEEDSILYHWMRDAETRGDAVSGNEIYKQLEKKVYANRQL